uniref:Cystatin n=1 Tax=Eriocheir sinensis TaxID=95602 RepID=D9YT49_ERISI|nr:cystatin [Eriocheir sinensis]
MGLRVISVGLFITTVLLGMKATAVGMPGGLSEEKPMTPEVQELINEVRPDVEEHLGRPVSRFEGLNYKTQVVSGLNYFVKVDIGDNEVVHIRVYHTFDGTNTLNGVQHFTDKLDRPISYF